MGNNPTKDGDPSTWVGIDDGKETTEKTYVPAHAGKWIEAVYTNEAATVDSILQMYERWLAEDEIKFVGLDTEYNSSQRKVAVMQLAMRDHVLVFHKIRYYHFPNKICSSPTACTLAGA